MALDDFPLLLFRLLLLFPPFPLLNPLLLGLEEGAWLGVDTGVAFGKLCAGESVGFFDGLFVGIKVGVFEGEMVGICEVVGGADPSNDGRGEGLTDGELVVGEEDGISDATLLGLGEGMKVGRTDGVSVGTEESSMLGLTEGEADGLTEGEFVGYMIQ